MTEAEVQERLRACLERMRERAAAPRSREPMLPLPKTNEAPPAPYQDRDRDPGEEG